MNKYLRSLLGIAAIAAIIPLHASQKPGDDIAIKLSTAMEKFYGKPVQEVDQFFTTEYGVKKPLQMDSHQVTYIVPVKDPFCGSVSVDTDKQQVVSWQTMTWKRDEQNIYGTACDRAFGNK
ncbi:MAG TPA: hypothetical protein ENJ84_05875 [Gammaproteobacteria bacterium]|nr:hypothetical protein [Gammaproteobacteria bacterium]